METIAYLRQFRAAGYALFDLAAAFLGMFLLSPVLSKIFRKAGLEIPKVNWVYLTLPLGVAAHLIVGKITPLTKDFIDLRGHYLLKIVTIALLFLGLRNIKRAGGAAKNSGPPR